jgi:hypothetical protein
MRVKSPSRIAAGSPSREVNRTAYTNCTILARRVEPQIPGIFASASEPNPGAAPSRPGQFRVPARRPKRPHSSPRRSRSSSRFWFSA